MALAQFAVLPIFLIWLALLGLGIYVLVIFIKLMKTGIKALELYISKNQDRNNL